MTVLPVVRIALYRTLVGTFSMRGSLMRTYKLIEILPSGSFPWSS
jgi:hypothetical protein